MMAQEARPSWTYHVPLLEEQKAKAAGLSAGKNLFLHDAKHASRLAALYPRMLHVIMVRTK